MISSKIEHRAPGGGRLAQEEQVLPVGGDEGRALHGLDDDPGEVVAHLLDHPARALDVVERHDPHRHAGERGRQAGALGFVVGGADRHREVGVGAVPAAGGLEDDPTPAERPRQAHRVHGRLGARHAEAHLLDAGQHLHQQLGEADLVLAGDAVVGAALDHGLHLVDQQRRDVTQDGREVGAPEVDVVVAVDVADVRARAGRHVGGVGAVVAVGVVDAAGHHAAAALVELLGSDRAGEVALEDGGHGRMVRRRIIRHRSGSRHPVAQPQVQHKNRRSPQLAPNGAAASAAIKLPGLRDVPKRAGRAATAVSVTELESWFDLKRRSPAANSRISIARSNRRTSRASLFLRRSRPFAASSSRSLSLTTLATSREAGPATMIVNERVSPVSSEEIVRGEQSTKQPSSPVTLRTEPRSCPSILAARRPPPPKASGTRRSTLTIAGTPEISSREDHIPTMGPLEPTSWKKPAERIASASSGSLESFEGSSATSASVVYSATASPASPVCR